MSQIFTTIKKRSRGTTLIETIVYLVILTLLMGVIVQVFIAMSGAYRNVKVARELEVSGTIALESMLREMRNAESVDLTHSMLGTSPGSITLSGVDEDDNAYTVAFNTVAGALYVSNNGGAPQALTPSSVKIDLLKFTRLATSTSEAVRVEMQVSNAAGPVSKSEKFYGFTVLRGSY